MNSTIDSYKENYNECREIFENYLTTFLDELSDIPEPVLSGIKYAMSAGGKRLRPVLALLTAKSLGVPVEKALPIGLAIELIHNYSLVHDDLPCMDDDELRRGKPTVHVVFGEGMAVLIGDALLNLSTEVLADNYFVFGNKLGEVLKIIYANSGSKGMIAGQCVDLESEGRENTFSKETLEYLHLHKTACLIKAPILAVAVLSEACQDVLDGLDSYADNLGLAFQITDDILDVEGDESIFGKPVGSDKEKGKLTYPAVYGLDESKKMAQACIRKAVESLSVLENKDNHMVLVQSVFNRIK